MFATPLSIIKQSQDLFLSESFAQAIAILRDCFNEEEVPTETIIQLLKGEIGYSIDGDNVLLGKEFIDEDYAEEVSQILENYDFLIKIENVNYQVTNCFDFDLSKIAVTHDYIKELNSLEDKLFCGKELTYFDEISSIMNKLGHHNFVDAEFIMYYNKRFYLVEKYRGNNIKEICKYYDPINAVKAFELSYNKYYG